MPTAAIIAIIVVVLLVLWAVVGGGRRDKAVAAARRKAAEVEKHAAADPDWGLMHEAAEFGITLDIPADQVTAPGQAAGRFTGSMMRVETYGQINRRVTATRLALIGVFALAATKQQDDRELYLTVEGDGFQIAARVEAALTPVAREFAAAYNTRSGALTSTANGSSSGGVAGQLAELGRLHDDGKLSDDEFAAAKAQLLAQ